MGNTFWGKNGSFHLQNSATDTFLAVLILSGSALAETDWEKATVVWLAAHDQSIIGRGVVGFPINEMGWTRESFDSQKQFVLRMIDGAMLEPQWDAIGFEPELAAAVAQWLLPTLAQFRGLVEEFTVGDVEENPDPGISRDWIAEECHGYPQCPKHGVYLHHSGCILCNADR